mgnify:FL=1
MKDALVSFDESRIIIIRCCAFCKATSNVIQYNDFGDVMNNAPIVLSKQDLADLYVNKNKRWSFNPLQTEWT